MGLAASRQLHKGLAAAAAAAKGEAGEARKEREALRQAMVLMQAAEQATEECG